MPQVTVYVRQEDHEKWRAIPKKSEFIHQALNRVPIPQLADPPTRDFQTIVREPEQYSLAWWRKEYPYDLFKEVGGEVMIQHKGTKQWARADEVY